LPSIIIEAHLDDDQLSDYKGTNNILNENAIGVSLEIGFDERYRALYVDWIKSRPSAESRTLPVDLYTINWRYFSDEPILYSRNIFKISYIDATTIRLQNGTDYYLSDFIKSNFDTRERVDLNSAHKRAKEAFSEHPTIKAINNKLSVDSGGITDKTLSIGNDYSHRSGWESSLTPHLDQIPMYYAGKGEQSALKILIALKKKNDSDMILIEEPENHLSHSKMSILINKIRETCGDKQIIITTHSTYVLNKLGLDSLLLLNDQKAKRMTDLPTKTLNYFKILSGYDTLRLVLARKAILVEGPSDELILQKAYQKENKKLPIEDGIEVINVRGLSFKNFLDIAVELSKEVSVITDNDGDHQKNVLDKYASYTDKDFIQVFSPEDNSLHTLEPSFVDANELEVLNQIFSKDRSKDELIAYMKTKKTDWALKIFESDLELDYPQYVKDSFK